MKTLPNPENVKRDARVVALWHKGVRPVEIAAALGVTKNVIAGVINRSRSMGLIPPPQGLSPEEVAARDIAARARRKARRDRMEVAMPKPKTRVTSPTSPTFDPAIADTNSVADTAGSDTGVSGKTPGFPLDAGLYHSRYPHMGHIVRDFFTPAPEDTPGVPLSRATSSQCRAVLPDVRHDGLALFCGKQVSRPGTSWCAAHRKLYFNRVPPRHDKPFITLPRKGP